MNRISAPCPTANSHEFAELVVVDAAHRDGVELERTKTGCRGRRDPVEHIAQAVAAGELPEPLGTQGVERDVEPAESCVDQVGQHGGKADPVRRHRDLDAIPLRARDRGEPAHDLDDVAPQQRLAACEPERRDAGGGSDPRDPLDLVERQDARAGEPFVALLGHAVGAAQRAAVGERDAQIAMDAAVRVDEGAARRGIRSVGGSHSTETPGGERDGNGGHASRLPAPGRGGAACAPQGLHAFRIGCAWVARRGLSHAAASLCTVTRPSP